MHVLPPSPSPFAVPTDRDMLPSERRAFVETHRTCVFAYARRDDGPAQSVVYYVPTDDGELLISTMDARAKAKAVERRRQGEPARARRALAAQLPPGVLRRRRAIETCRWSST